VSLLSGTCVVTGHSDQRLLKGMSTTDFNGLNVFALTMDVMVFEVLWEVMRARGGHEWDPVMG
jgi:hypothetical protein